jgi:Flp pilus assembly protein TadG
MQRTVGAPARAARRRQRGTALVELALLLPFLTIVFAGVVYLGRRELARQQALLTARSCAWRFSEGACQQIPAGCPEALFDRPTPAQPDPVILERVEAARAATQAPDVASGRRQNDFAAAVRDKVDRALGFVLSDTVTTTAVRTLTVPAPLPAARREVRASYYLPCNLAPTSPGQMAGELWDALWGAFR